MRSVAALGEGAGHERSVCVLWSPLSRLRERGGERAGASRTRHRKKGAARVRQAAPSITRHA